jgi:hypothetical protein
MQIINVFLFVRERESARVCCQQIAYWGKGNNLQKFILSKPALLLTHLLNYLLTYSMEQGPS